MPMQSTHGRPLIRCLRSRKLDIWPAQSSNQTCGNFTVPCFLWIFQAFFFEESYALYLHMNSCWCDCICWEGVCLSVSTNVLIRLWNSATCSWLQSHVHLYIYIHTMGFAHFCWISKWLWIWAGQWNTDAGLGDPREISAWLLKPILALFWGHQEREKQRKQRGSRR